MVLQKARGSSIRLCYAASEIEIRPQVQVFVLGAGADFLILSFTGVLCVLDIPKMCSNSGCNVLSHGARVGWFVCLKREFQVCVCVLFYENFK